MLPIGVIVAALGGLAIGIERQWSGHASGPRARFAGIRTFSLLGAAAGVSGWLWSVQSQALAAILLAGCAGLILAAYLAASRVDVDATTEVSAMVVLGAGTVAGLGYLALASALIAATTLVLIEKSRLHALVKRLDDEGLRAATRFAVMALVVLPLLPTGPYGPLGTVRPRALWMLVLFFSGLSFAAYIARRAVGARYGYVVAGLLGGLISSTNVTLTFARVSRTSASAGVSLAHGVVAACTILFVRVVVATIVLNPRLAWALMPYVVPPFIVGGAAMATGVRYGEARTNRVEPPNNPLAVGAALQMAALFQVVLTVVALARQAWGETGIMVSGAVLGITDVDALTVSMSQAAASGVSVDIAARGIGAGILANTVLKLLIALTIGAGRFRAVVAVSLLAIGTALGGALAWPIMYR